MMNSQGIPLLPFFRRVWLACIPWVCTSLVCTLLMPGPAGWSVATVPATACGQQADENRPELVVIAPQEWLEDLKGYLEQRKQNVDGSLWSIEQILREEAGVDDAEKIKRFLFRRYSQQKFEHVLLVGDADVLPVRYMMLDRLTAPAANVAFYPSDLYFADLTRKDGSFEDWNGEQSGHHADYFGEVNGEENKAGPLNFDRIDYLPEVAVGRWPASNREELQSILAKSVRYEQQVLAGGEVRTAFFAVQGWIDCRPTMEAMARQLEPAATVFRHLFADPSATPEELAVVDAAHAVRRLNEGLSLLVHAGHGHPHGWEHSLSVQQLGELRNGHALPVIVSAGCSTAAFATLPPYESWVDRHGNRQAGTNRGQVFDSPPPAPACLQPADLDVDSLAERLLFLPEHGAIAYYGCNTGSQPCALGLVEGFVGCYAQAGTKTLGECWQGAIRHYHDSQRLAELQPDEGWYPPSIFFQGMKFMYFGDPSLPVPHSATPAGKESSSPSATGATEQGETSSAKHNVPSIDPTPR